MRAITSVFLCTNYPLDLGIGRLADPAGTEADGMHGKEDVLDRRTDPLRVFQLIVTGIQIAQHGDR